MTLLLGLSTVFLFGFLPEKGTELVTGGIGEIFLLPERFEFLGTDGESVVKLGLGAIFLFGVFPKKERLVTDGDRVPLGLLGLGAIFLF